MEEKLQEIFDYYKNEASMEQPELVVAMLTELQDAAGYLSADVQRKAAEIAKVNPGYVAAVIKSLPNLHSKPFKHEIRICISDRCKAKDGKEVLKKFQQVLKIKPGQVTRDGMFLLNTEYCMHNCVNGPNIKIDGEMHQNMKPSDVMPLVQKLRAGD